MKSEADFSPTLLHKMSTFEVRGGFAEPVSDAPLYPIEVYAVRLVDVATVTNSFELYLDYGIRMKGRSPAVQTFVVQLAGSASCLPTERAVRQGGWCNRKKTAWSDQRSGSESFQRP